MTAGPGSGDVPAHHLPAPGRPVPTGTYRVQLHPGFTFDDAAGVVGYLADLGISHVHLSPVLAAAPGSTHGYDVVDHGRLSAELGGDEGWTRLAGALAQAGLGAVLDVVPNHMGLPVPESLNAAWWAMLRDGRSSAYARWFDVDWDWSTAPGRVLVPVLGGPIGTCLDAGEITLDRAGPAPVVRYFDHVFPVAPGTRDRLDGPLSELLDAQHYRLAHWRLGGDELNYRRFFDVTTLVGVRVEDPVVFAATSRRLLDLVADGTVTGLRIDHPDGLADPAGYLHRLAAASGGVWTVVEKILAADETLPADWRCAGTTGYDAMREIAAVLTDPAGEEPLTAALVELTGSPAEVEPVIDAAKAQVLRDVLVPEVERLTDALLAAAAADRHTADMSRRGLREALVCVLAHFPVYRAYVHPTGAGGASPDAAAAEARARLDTATAAALAAVPHRRREVELVGRLALAGGGKGQAAAEFAVRFQQTTGPVMGKGVEDTAFYRWFRLSAHNEVGGDPGRFAGTVEDFHAAQARMAAQWPATGTTLSTHDTKRSEDVRMRLLALAEVPDRWRVAAGGWRAAAARHRSARGWPDPPTEYLFWQTLVGAWPIDADRMVAYLTKATKEAKLHTAWVDGDPDYDGDVERFARAVMNDAELMSSVAGFVDVIAGPGRYNTISAKLVQLTVPGVPEVYQGTELEALALVDPDNRRPVDFPARRRLLAGLDGAGIEVPPVDPGGRAKLLVTARVLRLRRRHPDWFGPDAGYRPLAAEGPSAGHLVAFDRAGRVVTLATRLPVGLTRTGGWASTTVALPAGRWTDRLTGATWAGRARLAAVLERLPVALLVRED